MYFVLAIFLIIILSVLDGSISSSVLMILILIGGIMACMSLPKSKRMGGYRLLAIIYSVYISVAFIASLSFSEQQSFYVSDSMRYISGYIHKNIFHYTFADFYEYYYNFSDTNILYNAYLTMMSVLMNKHFGGMTVFGLTLCQTLFGILSSIVMYKIFLRHFNEKYAYRQVLIFTLCSQFFLYSTLIIRDVTICFLYLVAFDIIDRKFSLKGLLLLCVVMLLAWGVRLYSGVFVMAFIWYYLYTGTSKGAAKSIVQMIAIIMGVIVLAAILGSALMEQTTEELDYYAELSQERSSGGIVSRLMNLPPGISHFCIVFFTMIRPLPPFSAFTGVESFSNFSIATLVFVSGFFWFVCFYTYVLLAVFNSQLKKLDFKMFLLLGIVFVFLLANASHPDVRRMLPVFPIIYLLISEAFREPHNIRSVKQYKKALIVGFISLGIIFIFF